MNKTTTLDEAFSFVYCTDLTPSATPSALIVRKFGLVPYISTWQAMQHFTQTRTLSTTDEIWLLEHPAVYTLGKAGKPEHILNPGAIPIVKTDRGGQVTYHGPGQLVCYVLINLERKGYNIRDLVCRLEQAMIHFLHTHGISAHQKPKAPGVYVQEAKIGAIGLRISRGCSYHGLSFNVNMDLQPFLGINPCGFAKLPIVQCRDILNNSKLTVAEICPEFIASMAHILEYENLFELKCGTTSLHEDLTRCQ